MLSNKIPDNLKGKAIQVEHYLYDELWNSGPKKIPDEIIINSESTALTEEETKTEQVK